MNGQMGRKCGANRSVLEDPLLLRVEQEEEPQECGTLHSRGTPQGGLSSNSNGR